MTSQSIEKLWRLARQARIASRGSASHGPAGLPLLVFMTDRSRVPDPATTITALPPGSAVILRDYDATDRPAMAALMASLCQQRHLMFLVAGDEALARDVKADGMHFPEHQVPRLAPVRHRHPDWWISTAAHSLPALLRAERNGADMALLSPAFATDSHKGAKSLGPTRFTALARQANLPVYALGGIKARSASRLKGAHTAGFAAIGALATSGQD